MISSNPLISVENLSFLNSNEFQTSNMHGQIMVFEDSRMQDKSKQLPTTID